MRLLQLRDIGAGDPLLLVVGIEDGGPILRAEIRPLAVEFGRIVRH